jgi:hypothetical protein
VYSGIEYLHVTKCSTFVNDFWQSLNVRKVGYYVQLGVNTVVAENLHLNAIFGAVGVNS